MKFTSSISRSGCFLRTFSAGDKETARDLFASLHRAMGCGEGLIEEAVKDKDTNKDSPPNPALSPLDEDDDGARSPNLVNKLLGFFPAHAEVLWGVKVRIIGHRGSALGQERLRWLDQSPGLFVERSYGLGTGLRGLRLGCLKNPHNDLPSPAPPVLITLARHPPRSSHHSHSARSRSGY